MTSVTRDECDTKHRSTKVQLTIISGALICLMTGISWSVMAGYSASSTAEDVQHALEMYKAINNERNIQLQEDVKEIKLIVRELHKRESNP